jgi:hypothetical protein
MGKGGGGCWAERVCVRLRSSTAAEAEGSARIQGIGAGVASVVAAPHASAAQHGHGWEPGQ